MSGGSMNYVYMKVDDAAQAFSLSTPLRRAFSEHLSLVAKALHDIEWVDSCDYGKGDEEAAIRKVFAHAGSTPELAVLIAEAKAARDALSDILNRVPTHESKEEK